MRGGDVLDDGQAETGATGGPVARRVDPVETFEDPVQLLVRDADALVDHGDRDVGARRPCVETSDRGSATRACSTRRWRPGWRPLPVTCSALPEHLERPVAPLVTDSDVLGRPRRWRRCRRPSSIAPSIDTVVGISSGSSPWRRDSSMTCCTSRESRSLSTSIRGRRTACTASGSSAASCTASPSRPDGTDRRLEFVADVADEVTAHGLDPSRRGCGPRPAPGPAGRRAVRRGR